MLENWLGLEAKRKRLLRKAPAGVLQDFLSVPFPSLQEQAQRVPILSVDFETTGLKPNTDQILSIGHIEIRNHEIILSSANHQIICTSGNLSEENVVIHQITDDAKTGGEKLELVVENLLSALAGKAMLVHFGRIEKTFLDAACKQIYGMAPVFPMIDTLTLAKRRLDRATLPYDPSQLRLFNLREKYELPQYGAHNALSDAIATAELFFAEIASMENNTPTLKNILV